MARAHLRGQARYHRSRRIRTMKPSKRLLQEVEESVRKFQPDLRVEATGEFVAVRGKLVVSSSSGPIDTFDVEIFFYKNYPKTTPIVFEVGERIPRTLERHVFPKAGACCLGVWEAWLAEAKDHSVDSFFTGPLHSYFLGQAYFEVNGQWPFGDEKHGTQGILEAYARTLGCICEAPTIHAFLKVLGRDRPKGHWLCPCDSGLPIRDCCAQRIHSLHKKVPPHLARRMLKELQSSAPKAS